MDLNVAGALLIEQIHQTSVLEWTAVAFGVSQVLLARKNNILLYPTGIISVCCASILLFPIRAYVETLLQGYYLLMSIYGAGQLTAAPGKNGLPGPLLV
nr:nicotinamide mononucleotide transporter family protein [Haliscomenobacter sp.]